MKELLAVSLDKRSKLYKTQNGNPETGHLGIVEQDGEPKGTEEHLLEILKGTRTDWIPADEGPETVIDPLYLPFTAKVVDEHLVKQHLQGSTEIHGTTFAREGVAYYQKSARRYRLFGTTGVSPESLSLSQLRRPCQIQKDERFWTATCMLRTWEAKRFPNLLESAFGNRFSPVDGTQWSDLIGGKTELWLEKPLPSPRRYTQFLADQYRNSKKVSDQFGLVPYNPGRRHKIYQ